MPIDVTKPADGLPSVKADMRANLQAAKDGIEGGVSTNSGTAITVNAASFGDRQYIKILCTGGTTVTVTLANDVPAGKLVELVRKGAGNVTTVAGSGATRTPTASTGNWGAGIHSTTDADESLCYTVDTNSGSNAAWRLVARP